MKPYLVSLALGVLVGVIYALFSVRSPAPPIIALVGLLGILAGEQLPPLAKRLLDRSPASTSWLHHQVKPHMFGRLPECAKEALPPTAGVPVANGEQGRG
ncbi:XapX domain-containing protein [Variovorax saccharolyticus]|uniref:XapX domain-containing protein n=1 Tax=Variovorax saccharolyticus TaxID=3053516 RepID=UPI002577E504|nr:XapX domain-containing protein [Variovorax sp. J22R187]MDM0019558.1 XapX domain-containing protein [Variovorax sp. J22R187]